ncbi:HAD-superfamily, subfamily-IB PSPase-like hydrolase [Caldisphaera lagunensis DSM 15908]|uniref:phosphoserine phosphatase n=1 Tax=Caldisphaera lagunensis (strain DSM 15908 / JCM 11604 / ANMR 0165 / IC-154) TaxID=1056495 RepID=L0A9E9_CALLD|nr:HAD-IB family phosphatase [Caldisphaera lagunensis]AFZ70523.1 HAD-superfamily, subfamily-IB PSPase-like hydrolase [Caldisphaera lagunensis DSM 15908]
MGKIKLVVFDVDGVLTKEKSSWGFVHKHFNVEDKAKIYFEKFEKGEINYVDWMKLDTSLWIEKNNGKLKRETLIEILNKIEVRPEAQEVSMCLHKKRKLIALISGGIDLLVSRISKVIGADFWFANELEFDKFGYLIPGGYPLVGVNKEKPLKMLLLSENIKPDEAAYVGDSTWDASAMKLVKYPIQFGDDESLSNIAKFKINNLKEICNIINEIEKI